MRLFRWLTQNWRWRQMTVEERLFVAYMRDLNRVRLR